MLSSRDISLLRPDVAVNCRAWMTRCREAGLSVLVTSTVRDIEYQAWLYEQGRSRPSGIVTNGKRPTFHWDKAGLAFDFCKNVKGHEYDDAAFFRKAAAIAKEMGFTWGGDWKSFPDMPHIQWDGNGRYTNGMILAGQFPPLMPRYEEDDMDVEKLTQAQLIRLAERMQAALADRPVSDTLSAEVEAAKDRGITDGSGPNQFCTRAQAAAMVNRALRP